MELVKYPPILIIDDTPAIHEDFRKILDTQELDKPSVLNKLDETQEPARPLFEIHSAYQGEEGLACVVKALQEGKPFGVAFIDMRMPPGWDGIETTKQIWAVDPNIQVVICTAYSDYSWREMRVKLGPKHHWLILKKPFDIIEAGQIAYSLAEKWRLNLQVQKQQQLLEQIAQQMGTPDKI